jgi:hypothetical protein
MLSRAFATKGDLEQWIGCTEKDFNVWQNNMWPFALEHDLRWGTGSLSGSWRMPTSRVICPPGAEEFGGKPSEGMNGRIPPRIFLH